MFKNTNAYAFDIKIIKCGLRVYTYPQPHMQAHVHMCTCSHANAHTSDVMKHQNADYENMFFSGFFVK